jgi:hypothetical protein
MIVEVVYSLGMKIIFYYMTPCSLVEGRRSFGGNESIRKKCRGIKGSTPEMVVNFCDAFQKAVIFKGLVSCTFYSSLCSLQWSDLLNEDPA